MRFFRFKKALGLIFAILVSGVWVSFSQTAPGTDLNSAVLLQYLNQTIGWYQQLDLQRQLMTDPDEGMVVNDNQQIANQVVSLAFEFARAEAESIEKEEASGQAGGRDQAAPSRYQALRQMMTNLDQQVRANKKELESLQQKQANETGPRRESLQTRIDETKSELDLAQVRSDMFHTIAEFIGGSSTSGFGAIGLREKIEALARSVPAALAKPATKQGTPAPANEQIYPAPASGMRKDEPSGVWGLTLDVIAVSKRMRTIRDAIQLTDSLNQDLKGLRTPLVNTLRELSKRGDELAGQADTSDQILLVQQKAMLDAMTAQFKRTADSVLPLSKQGILLELYKKNLTNWLGSLETRYATELRNLLLRLVMLVVVLTMIIGGAELWRRAIFRYARDPRRRYQFLLMRKIVFWCVIAIVLTFSFANELSSVATFAGLITAGVAVALQSVILSIVAYFFLIGRYGIRVGDRVQVAGITGEVVDIGLVRFHLLELVSGLEKTASGRVVAFSNSIVFQSNAGFFKQIPGTNFVWHEVTLTVAPDSDYHLAEERSREVVEAIFKEYRDEMEKQYHHFQKTLAAAPAGALQPTSRLRPATSGLEVVIRYPVDMMIASEIDDRVTRELLSMIDREPKLKLAGSGKPPLRLKTDTSG
ncbi:MAG: mechanosensitive ion channel family protein [Acidobacteriia bacterium]|nr:mechanosensitive ion channel family protein [Terriglobia bacterium]